MAFVSGVAALSGTALVVSRGRGKVSRLAGIVSRRAGRKGAGAGAGAAGGRTGAGRGRVVSGSPFDTAPLAWGWRNSTGWKNAVAMDRPWRRAGAKRSLRAPVSAAESSAG